MTMGEKILMLRKAREMSQEQLAEQLGVSRQAVSKWELNEAVPDVNRVVAMSELFGVTTDYLLKDGNDGASFPQDVENKEVDAVVQDRKWLGVVLVIVCALALFGIWAIVEIKDHYYSWSGDFTYSGDGLVGYFLFNQGMIPIFLLLVYGVIGGIRILQGKPFLFKILTPSYWRSALDASGGILSEETKAYLQEDDSSSVE